MGWLTANVDVSADHVAAVEDVLLALGAVSVTLRDSGDNPVFQEQPGTLDLWPSVKLTGLFPVECASGPIREALMQVLGPGGSQQLAMGRVDDQNWTRVWMDNFHPMRFGERLWVVPHEVEIPEGAIIVLRLDPGLAFGTGTHPTTRLCLQWLESQHTAPACVVDYGCGSGILAIAAALLGTSKIFAIDHDLQALTATENNARMNGVDDRIITACTDTDVAAADLVMANILAQPLCILALRLAAITRTGGRLLLSGILLDQVDALLAAYAQWFDEVEQSELDGWVLLSARRNETMVS